LDVLPVLNREIVEGQQHITVFNQLSRGFTYFTP